MNIIKDFLLVVISVAILVPSIVGLSHILNHEQQEVCTDLNSTHFHEQSLDCEFCNLRISFGKTFIPNNYNLYLPQITPRYFTNPYQFLSDYQKLSFELRGPPAFI